MNKKVFVNYIQHSLKHSWTHTNQYSNMHEKKIQEIAPIYQIYKESDTKETDSYQFILDDHFSTILKVLPKNCLNILKDKVFTLVVSNGTYSAYTITDPESKLTAIVFPTYFFFLINKAIKYSLAGRNPHQVLYAHGINNPRFPSMYYKIYYDKFLDAISDGCHTVSQFDLILTNDPSIAIQRYFELTIVEIFAIGHELGHIFIDNGTDYFNNNTCFQYMPPKEIELYADIIGVDIMKKIISKLINLDFYSEILFTALSKHFVIQGLLENKNIDKSSKYPLSFERLNNIMSSIVDKELADIYNTAIQNNTKTTFDDFFKRFHEKIHKGVDNMFTVEVYTSNLTDFRISYDNFYGISGVTIKEGVKINSLNKDLILIAIHFIASSSLSGLTWDMIKAEIYPIIQQFKKLHVNKNERITVSIIEGDNKYDVDMPITETDFEIEIPEKLKLRLKTK